VDIGIGGYWYWYIGIGWTLVWWILVLVDIRTGGLSTVKKTSKFCNCSLADFV
jgi:hypothetical protein